MDLLKIPATSIAFQGGAYGQYVKWLMYTLLVNGPVVAPFKNSTSHGPYINDALVDQFVANDLVTLDRLTQPNTLKLSAIHPVVDGQDTDFIEQVDKISQLVDRVLIPYIDHSTYLLGIHNYLYKIWDDIWAGPLEYVDREDLARGWEVDTSQPLDTVSRWIVREHHSLNIFNSWESQCSWFAPTQMRNANCKFVFISDLFYNFLPTIESVRQFLGVEWIRDPATLLPYHKTNVSNQKYKNQDPIAKQILQSVADDTDFAWNANSITLYTEAYVQRALQQQGIMLQCNGLNDFPTSTKTLIEVFE